MGKESSVVRGCSSTIIPGLPNEVAVMILVRLPRALHGSFRRICRAWRDALRSSAVSALRETLHIFETWTLFLFRDKSIALYDPLLQRLSSPIPYFRDARCILHVMGAIGSQVFFMENPILQDPVNRFKSAMFCFDTANMQWQSDPIPVWNNALLYGFASVAFDGHLCVAGGHSCVAGGTVKGSRHWKKVRKVGRFDVKIRRWEMMPKMHEKRFAASAVVLQGRLLVIDGLGEIQTADIWDPRSGEWELEPKVLPAGVFPYNNLAVVMDTLYALSVLRDNSDPELFCYVSAANTWTSLGHLPVTEYSCCCIQRQCFRLVGAGKELWVVMNCDKRDTTCTCTILSCVPTTGPSPLLWTTVPVTSSDKFPPGPIIVHGNVNV